MESSSRRSWQPWYSAYGTRRVPNYKFEVDALFDIDPEKVGSEIMGVHCWHVEEMSKVMEERGIEVLILAVPASAAQNCVDKAVLSPTLKGILAFTPLQS
jgi:redox-sensing transcriptional repressor